MILNRREGPSVGRAHSGPSLSMCCFPRRLLRTVARGSYSGEPHITGTGQHSPPGGQLRLRGWRGAGRDSPPSPLAGWGDSLTGASCPASSSPAHIHRLLVLPPWVKVWSLGCLQAHAAHGIHSKWQPRRRAPLCARPDHRRKRRGVCLPLSTPEGNATVLLQRRTWVQRPCASRTARTFALRSNPGLWQCLGVGGRPGLRWAAQAALSQGGHESAHQITPTSQERFGGLTHPHLAK